MKRKTNKKGSEQKVNDSELEELEQEPAQMGEESNKSKGIGKRIKESATKAVSLVKEDISTVVDPAKKLYSRAENKVTDLATNKPKGFWGKVGYYGVNAGLFIKDIVTSKNFSRVMLFSSAIMMLSSTGPIGAGVACGVVLGVVAAGVAWDSYQKYKLSRLQAEDKVLEKMLGHEQEKCQSITVMRGKVVNSTKLTDEQKREYFECIKSVEGNMDIMKSRQFHPEMTSKTVGRTIMGVVPEGLVSLGMSIATMNPLSIVVSTASLALAGKSEYEFNKEFTHRKTQLLNSMDNTRVYLNIDEYSKGKGIDVLKEREFYRGVEVKAFEKFRDYLNVHIEKGEPLPKGAREQYDIIYKDEVAKAQSQFPKHETFGDKAKDYFSSMKDVIIKGFSVNQTTAMYNPFAKRGENPESLQGKIDNLRSASIKLEKEIGSKGKVEQPSKQQFTDMVSRPKQASTQIGA